MIREKKGFTLTEVLLAVMVVGLIGIALASLTTAASREAGVGRSKILLRNDLSLFSRMLRDDINAATYINNTNTSITLCDNMGMSGAPIPSLNGLNGCVKYTYTKGTVSTNANGDPLVPASARLGGVIKRDGQVVLRNVKDMSYNGYTSPLFKRVGNATTASALDVTIVTEVRSNPPVNDMIQETFLLPNGL